jgi:hypothetical protein
VQKTKPALYVQVENGGMDGTRRDFVHLTEKLHLLAFRLVVNDLERAETCSKFRHFESRNRVAAKFWAKEM